MSSSPFSSSSSWRKYRKILEYVKYFARVSNGHFVCPLFLFWGGGRGGGEREAREGSGKMSWPCHPLCLLISVSVLLFSTNNSAAHLTHSFITKISHFSMNPSHFWIFPFSHFPSHHFLVSLFFFFSVS